MNKELIEHVANVAKIRLSKEEIERFIPEFNDILEAFSKIKEVNTGNVKPSFQPVELSNIMREDEVGIPFSQEDALSNTQHKKDGYFKGPSVI